MKVAVAWNGPESRRVFDRGLANQETMELGDARGVVEALEEAGHQAWLVQGDIDLPQLLESELGEQDIVFNTAYGAQGVARYAHVPGMLESAGFRYTGSDPLGHALALEKPIAKSLMRTMEIPTPDWQVFVRGRPVGDLPAFGYPVVVKPTREGGSLGLHLAEDEGDVQGAVDKIHRDFGQDAMVERFVPGKDLMVPILGNEHPTVLPIVQVETIGHGQELLTQDHKQGRGARPPRVRCPAELDDATRRRVEAFALATYRTLGMRDWARIDMRLSRNGAVHTLEINSLPGLGHNSSFLMAAREHGMGYPGLVDRIVETATRRWEARERRLERIELAMERGGAETR